ncbi:MAG: hypothetical protein AAF721_37335 [Myxococcota bacterium]
MRSLAQLALAFAALCLLSLVGPSRAIADETTPAEVTQARPPLIVVRGLGPVPQESLRTACRVLLAEYPVRCEIREARSIFEAMAGWNEKREQLDASRALDALFRNRPTDALVELNLTNVDIYEQAKPYVFGLASLTDRVALVSLSRIDGNASKLPGRLEKLVLHETGHALGLVHHDDHDCSMRQDPTVASLDDAPGHLCETCHAQLVANASKLARPGQIALDRARSHLVRGETDRAREQLVTALWKGQHDSELLNGFALAFIEARQWNEAISVLKYVLDRQAQYAEAHVNLGLAYQMRGRKGDLPRAVAHFEQALDIRPDWELVHAHLSTLTSTPSAAQGPASED